MSSRIVRRIVPAIRTTEGEGFVIRRPFPTQTLMQVDPFLLLDHFGPIDYAPGEAKGAPNHPHRGFETVSYLLEGEFEHKDSMGNHGLIDAGGAQWMTAGAGVIHDEMPSQKIRREGGRVHGFQIWVNLPKRDKMMPPRYQDIPAAKIPVATSDDGKTKVRVVAGSSLGVSAVIETRTPIFYLHFTLQPGARHVQQVPSGYTALAYVISGELTAGENQTVARESDMAMFDDQGDEVVLRVAEAASGPAEFLLLGGEPLREPVARYGPFVMNTRQEIEQAFDDYRAGKLGQLRG